MPSLKYYIQQTSELSNKKKQLSNFLKVWKPQGSHNIQIIKNEPNGFPFNFGEMFTAEWTNIRIFSLYSHILEKLNCWKWMSKNLGRLYLKVCNCNTNITINHMQKMKSCISAILSRSVSGEDTSACTLLQGYDMILLKLDYWYLHIQVYISYCF